MKSITEIRRTLEGKGWTLARLNSHAVWRCPCGQHSISVSARTKLGGGRAYENTMALIKRYEGCVKSD